MNNKQSTPYQPSNPEAFSGVPEYAEVSASSIPPGRSEADVTYDDVIDVIDKFLATTGNAEYSEKLFLDRGLTKQSGSKITVHKLVKNFNLLLVDYINTNNKNLPLKQKNIINHYMSSVTAMSNILDNVDIEVAGNDIMCYIIGYMIKTLKTVKLNTLYNEDK